MYVKVTLMPRLNRFPALAPLALLLITGCKFSVGSTGTDGDSTGGTECGDIGTHTNLDCTCEPGYSKCDPGDPDAIACCMEALSCPDPNSELIGTQCKCKLGYEWCNPDDTEDLTCCAESTTSTSPTTTSPTGTTTSQGTTTTTATSEGTTTTTATTGESTGGDSTTGGEVCMGAQPPPDTCEAGNYWCTQTEACGPEGSELFRCVDGAWFADTSLAKDNCLFDGYDFAYGCVDNGQAIEFICGDGPGTDCDGSEPSTCLDEKLLQECTLGKLSEYDCLTICTEIGDDMGTLYDHGYCGERMGATGCLCCDMGDPGCPI
jgi:hypothetical protein